MGRRRKNDDHRGPGETRLDDRHRGRQLRRRDRAAVLRLARTGTPAEAAALLRPLLRRRRVAGHLYTAHAAGDTGADVQQLRGACVRMRVSSAVLNRRGHTLLLGLRS